MKSGIDLVLVNPGGRSRIYQGLATAVSAVEPPVWAGLLAAFVRNKGFSVRVLDANAFDLDPGETAKRVVEMVPLLVAVVVYGHNPSASTQVMPAAGEVCEALKREAPDLKTILVGGHVAALPERTLREESADYVCGGEGPNTLVDLLNALKSNDSGLGKVRDLWYRDGAGVVRSNAPAPLVTDLDGEMEGIAWDLLPMEKYRAHNWHCFGGIPREPYAALYTTLGCPHHCGFCCIQAPFRRGEAALGYGGKVNSYRYWSPRKVIEQIDALVTRYGVRNIKFADEMFVMNKEHVHSICDLIVERGYDLNIWAYARVDTVGDDSTLEKLKKAGFNWLAFGIEAGTDRVLADVRKGFKQDKVLAALEKVRAAGINIGANYIFGLPEDDMESMQATLDLAVGINAEFANFYSAMAYPGSRLYETALEEGWPLPEGWGGYSQYARDALPLPTRRLSGLDVLRFRDNAFQVYYGSPRYLDMIERKFGRETADSIRRMALLKVERKN